MLTPHNYMLTNFRILTSFKDQPQHVYNEKTKPLTLSTSSGSPRDDLISFVGLRPSVSASKLPFNLKFYENSMMKHIVLWKDSQWIRMFSAVPGQ